MCIRDRKKVNLRDLYPDVYKTDHFVEVTEDVLETIRAAERAEASYDRRMYRYKAYYSLDLSLIHILIGIIAAILFFIERDCDTSKNLRTIPVTNTQLIMPRARRKSGVLPTSFTTGSAICSPGCKPWRRASPGAGTW